MNNEAEKLNQAFDQTGIEWHSRANALAKFREERDILYENGEPFAKYDSEILPLHDALSRWAYDHRNPELFDGRTLPRTGVGVTRPGLACKANFKNIREKIAYIEKYGEDAFAKLPLTGVSGSEVLTQDDWLKLPRAEKVRRTQADAYAFSRLPRAAKPDPNAKALSKKEEMAANLAKHVATKGRR